MINDIFLAKISSFALVFAKKKKEGKNDKLTKEERTQKREPLENLL